MKTKTRWLGMLACAAAVHAAVASAQQVTARPHGTAVYVSGGVGVAAQERMKALEDEFNLKLVFTLVEGNYLADVDVVVRDATGRPVLNGVADGPFFLARLPAGHYRVSATYEGITKARNVRVGERLHTEYLRWPSRPGVDFPGPKAGSRGRMIESAAPPAIGTGTAEAGSRAGMSHRHPG